MDSTEIEKKMQIGDLKTLAKMLGINYDAAKKRYYRDINTKRYSKKNEEAKELMVKIIEAREKLITEENTPECDIQVKTIEYKKTDNKDYP